MSEGGRLVDEYIGGNRKDNAVRALFLTILSHLHTLVGGQSGSIEETGDAAAGNGNDLIDDGCLLFQRQQSGLCRAAQDKELAGAILDLTVDEGGKALEIHLVILGKRGGHRYPGALEIDHRIMSFLMWSYG